MSVESIARASTIAASVLALALLCALCWALPAHARPPAFAAGVPKVHLDGPIPTLLSAGERVKLSGRVSGGSRGEQIALESHAGGAWKIVKRAPVSAGAFKLAWTPAAGQTLTLRLTLRLAGRVIAYSSKLTLRVGPAPQFCPKAPAPTSVPAGDGWVYGGLYDSGGPAPGVFNCQSGPYTVVAVDEAGQPALSQPVSGMDYVLLLPAGSYELEADESSCFSEAAVLVVAGKGVKANTICDVP